MKKNILCAIVILAILQGLMACSSNVTETPESTQPEPTVTLTPSPTPIPTATTSPTPTENLSPAAITKFEATPTVFFEWFDPINTMDESDYKYYDQLLLTEDDQSALGRIHGASGLSLTQSDTCDLQITRYIYVDHIPSGIRLTFYLLVHRYISNDEAVSSFGNRIEETLAKGASQVEIASNLSLPDETTAFTAANTIFVISRYEGFEILLAQDLETELPIDETVNLFLELLDLQIEKLKSVGY